MYSYDDPLLLEFCANTLCTFSDKTPTLTRLMFEIQQNRDALKIRRMPTSTVMAKVLIRHGYITKSVNGKGYIRTEKVKMQTHMIDNLVDAFIIKGMVPTKAIIVNNGDLNVTFSSMGIIYNRNTKQLGKIIARQLGLH